MSNKNNYCIIMSGGVGSRFWPFSKEDKPKQFLDFFGSGRSLLQSTYDRFKKIVLPENIYIVTNDAYADMTKMQLLSYGTQAITNGWLTYDIEQFTLNDADVFTTGYVGSNSVVFMDFPLAANRVQTSIYGESNIELPDDRVKLFSLIKRFT